jgi:DNA helicase-2/ATP-dependent DNA helicase PcrA
VPESLVRWRREEPGRSGPVCAIPSRTWQNTSTLSLEVGDRVTHDKYGLGTVVAADGSGPRATVTINFGSAGTIRLMLIGGVPLVKL